VRQSRTLGSVREEARSAPWSTYTRTQPETADRAKEGLQLAATSSTRKPNKSGDDPQSTRLPRRVYEPTALGRRVLAAWTHVMRRFTTEFVR
jgi:hypothetical protein